jgi:hypothetical protein
VSACKHHWVHLETKQEHSSSGYGEFHRRDVYHCDKCLELAVKEQYYYGKGGGDTHVPDWFTGPVPGRGNRY